MPPGGVPRSPEEHRAARNAETALNKTVSFARDAYRQSAAAYGEHEAGPLDDDDCQAQERDIIRETRGNDRPRGSVALGEPGRVRLEQQLRFHNPCRGDVWVADNSPGDTG